MVNIAEDNYSEIIDASQYNQLMSEQHLYISSADKFIKKFIQEKAFHPLEVVEVGCGPARVLSRLSDLENINLTGIDIDRQFLEYARKALEKTKTKVLYGDVTVYKHGKPVDIFYSQGFHHHLPKGIPTQTYLHNIYGHLNEGGYYILSDEFVPDYETEEERSVRLVIWYSHIIAHALDHDFLYLAQEEAKTLLDDLSEGKKEHPIKTNDQINFVLSKVETINRLAMQEQPALAVIEATEFLEGLEKYYKSAFHNNDKTLDLSRGDFKICEKALYQEVKQVGFITEGFKHFGPVDIIGGISIYIFRKG